MSASTNMTTTVVAASTAALLTAAAVAVGLFPWQRSTTPTNANKGRQSEPSAYETLIGDTPCILLPSLSRLLQRDMYVKMESWNPGGTGKDRAASNIIAAAEQDGTLPKGIIVGMEDPKRRRPDLQFTIECNNNNNDNDDDRILQASMTRSRTGGLVVEGTSGSTGIALAALAVAKGHACLVILPDDQADEKRILLQVLGAHVHVVPTASIANPNHYVNIARRLATRAVVTHGLSALFCNQFENEDNWKVHYDTTGPEIWRQCRPDAFCMSTGTGGTIAGVARYLKEQQRNDRGVTIVLVDPPGSVLYSKVTHGVAFASQQRESALLRHRYDTIAEGIGLDRITRNMTEGLPYVDCAVQVSDQEAVDMAHYILNNEGLLVGSSSAMNLVGAVRTALTLPPGSRICTVVCDSGQRHITRFWNRDFIRSKDLLWPADDISLNARIPECLKEAINK